MNLGTAQVIRGNALALPLADNSVDLCVSSPPYWSLRSYQDGGAHYEGQIGSEETSDEFLDALLGAMRECIRVTKPTGSIFFNLGDKYLPNKSLALLPERFRIRVADEIGLIARAVIVWSKPNGLPESVTDRVRRSHEDWMHFTLSPRYFSAVDEIREAHEHPELAKRGRIVKPVASDLLNECYSDRAGNNPLGKLPGSVWVVPTEPLRVPDHLGIDHFAAFPTAWPKRIIQGWSPSGVCVECGEGRRPVAEHTEEWAAYKAEHGLGDYMADGQRHQALGVRRSQTTVPIPAGGKHRITGYACACPNPTAPTTPSVILDPFGGTGTTALVAKALGRHGITVDMSADYCRLAEWRTNDRDQLAKVLGIPKADTPTDNDQLDLFTEESA